MGLSEKLVEKEKKLNNFDVKYWKPEAGEAIEGIVTEIGSTIGEFGEQEFLQVDVKGEEYMVFANSVLKKQIEEEKVSVGDVIAVKYLGLVKSKKKNREYKNFVLVKDDSVEGKQGGDSK